MTDIDSRFDEKLFELVPHRPPMLLVNKLRSVSDKRSEAEVVLDRDSSFADDTRGVPAWVGIEYMGQTAALIAGYQQQQGVTEPHLGFLLGTRRYKSCVDYFALGSTLRVVCEELAVVGDSLATFNCSIFIDSDEAPAAEAKLSVFRKPLKPKDNGQTAPAGVAS